MFVHLNRLAPDLMEQILKRLMVLDEISAMQPVGRRALSQKTMMPEREIRVISEALKTAGLVEADPAGMHVTRKALADMNFIHMLAQEKRGLTQMQTRLQTLLGVKNVLIAPGDMCQSTQVLTKICRLAADKLRQVLRDDMILAVTGGTTIAEIARLIPRGARIDVQVIPARGGVGYQMETQASTLAEEIAHRLGGRHRTLLVPDSIGADALKSLLTLAEIREPLEALKHADVLLYGIGRADVMARNRNTSPKRLQMLMDMGAVAEALGYYFDKDGRVIEQASGLGLPVDEIDRIPTVIAVAGGCGKAEAIYSVVRHHKHDYLIIDEGAANALMRLATA